MQIDSLALPKGKEVKKPDREPDMISGRGKAYWFGPEWVREIGKGYGRILPGAVNNKNTQLHMLSKKGNLSYIKGSIQIEFHFWHEKNKDNIVPWREDFEVDCILLGMEPSDLLLSDWEYV